ncbi:RNA binding protein [Arthrobacter phage TforTroy]|uniref:RNA binding protein n=1 Tax=Arthrobacter phage TforTroy TaxID=3118973 RepID=A0ABZ2CRV4_9CAUD
MTPQARLTAARNTGSPVRVTLDDGRVLVGVPYATLTGQHAIKPAGASRPVLFSAAQVIEVLPA